VIMTYSPWSSWLRCSIHRANRNSEEAPIMAISRSVSIRVAQMGL